MRLHCYDCGKCISTEVPGDTVVRAYLQCPECLAGKGADGQAIHDLVVWLVCNGVTLEELTEHWEGCAGAEEVASTWRQLSECHVEMFLMLRGLVRRAHRPGDPLQPYLDAIDAWHESDSTLQLWECLGLSEQEYVRMVNSR